MEEIIKDNDEKAKKFSSVLEEEVEYDIYEIDLELFPEDIEPRVLEALDDLIKV